MFKNLYLGKRINILICSGLLFGIHVDSYIDYPYKYFTLTIPFGFIVINIALQRKYIVKDKK